MGTKPEVSLAERQEAAGSIHVDLPFPPSVNHYWRHSRGRHYIGPEGKQYGILVKLAVNTRLKRSGEPTTPIAGPIVVDITAYPPDRRLRDLDNLLKATLDALQRAGVYADDHQIKEINLRWGPVVKSGAMDVTLSPMVNQAAII